jgi:hypothetical protein
VRREKVQVQPACEAVGPDVSGRGLHRLVELAQLRLQRRHLRLDHCEFALLLLLSELPLPQDAVELEDESGHDSLWCRLSSLHG